MRNEPRAAHGGSRRHQRPSRSDHSTAVSPDARQIWSKARGPLIILLVIIVAGIVVALVRGGGEGGALEPDTVTPSGSRALARLLAAEGVRIERVSTAVEAEAAVSAGPATLLVTRPEWVVPQRLAEFGWRAAELVLVGPPEDVIRAFAVPVRIAGTGEVTGREPDCLFEAARAAGEATMGGDRYEGEAPLCYDGTLARSGTITLLGTGAPLTNERLDERGDAALAMRLLGRHERLVWYTPSLGDPSARPGERPLADLLPDGWRFGLIQAVVAVALVALWRARRLGPVVAEPLPVVVHAAETVTGRARLYRRAGAADHAAEALRAAARGRLIHQLGLPRDAPPEAVAGALAERCGRPGAEVHDLLYGPPPAGEAALVRLADALDVLENEVTHR